MSRPLDLLLLLYSLVNYITTIAIKYFLAYSLTMRCLPGGLLHLFQIRNVVVHCRGGLGNQLFQASAGHLLAKELKTSFFIELFRTTAHNALNPVDISKLEVLKKYTGRQTYIRKLYSRFILKLNWIFPSFDLSSVG